MYQADKQWKEAGVLASVTAGIIRVKSVKLDANHKKSVSKALYRKNDI